MKKPPYGGFLAKLLSYQLAQTLLAVQEGRSECREPAALGQEWGKRLLRIAEKHSQELQRLLVAARSLY